MLRLPFSPPHPAHPGDWEVSSLGGMGRSSATVGLPRARVNWGRARAWGHGIGVPELVEPVNPDYWRAEVCGDE